MSTATTLLTAEEYFQLPDLGYPSELVRGQIVEMNIPAPKHGSVCANVVHIGLLYRDEHKSIRVFCNDTAVITEREPDTVRGPDVWFARVEKLAKGPLPSGYLDVVPDVAFEVLSPSDRWDKVLAKVSEYLAAGVPVVCVLDPDEETAQLFFPDQPNRTFTAEEELTFPDLLPGFSVRVGRFFE